MADLAKIAAAPTRGAEDRQAIELDAIQVGLDAADTHSHAFAE